MPPVAPVLDEQLVDVAPATSTPRPASCRRRRAPRGGGAVERGRGNQPVVQDHVGSARSDRARAASSVRGRPDLHQPGRPRRKGYGAAAGGYLPRVLTPRHDPDQPLLREGSLGARPGGDPLPRETPHPGRAPDRGAPRRGRQDRAGTDHARRSARGVGRHPRLGGRAHSRGHAPTPRGAGGRGTLPPLRRSARPARTAPDVRASARRAASSTLSFNNRGVPRWEDRRSGSGGRWCSRFASARARHHSRTSSAKTRRRLARVRLRRRPARRRTRTCQAIAFRRPTSRSPRWQRRWWSRPSTRSRSRSRTRCRRGRATSSSAPASTRPARTR